MSEIAITIDGREIRIEEGATILEAAQSAGIGIPTLCHHEKLTPFGACRICMVDVTRGDRTDLVVSCVVPAEDGAVVATRSERIDRYRKTLLELMLSQAPHAPRIVELAREYGADADRFEPEPSFCIHCGLCVRYCAEVKGAHAVGFIDRGVRKEIAFIPEIAATECETCKECFPLCPTSYAQAAYVLTDSLTSST